MTLPFVSVVVLNYNSLRFLDGCLGSLARLDYPRDRFEIVLVDNASRDGSAEIAEKRYPFVRVVRNGRNLGFAGGNNVALRSASADYVLLLNNDTSVDPLWLARLVEAAERDPQVGACTSKLLFQHNRARISLESDTFRPSDLGSSDPRELGVRVLSAETLQDEDTQAAEYLEGFHGQEPSPDGPFRWSSGRATVGLRLRRDGGPAALRLKIAAPRPDAAVVVFSLAFDDQQLGQWQIGADPIEIALDLPEDLIQIAGPVIQNAGTLILRGGSGRDRGAVVWGTEVFQEDDNGQYDRQEEVFAGCGAAVLLRKTMLQDVGVFDDDFFMYYEDMDLSWRMRRRGWKVIYVPDAVVRHLHCGSSVEWSPLFVFHVERNRLLMLAKNAPARLAISEYLRYFVSTGITAGRFVRAFLLRTPDLAAVHSRAGIQIKVFVSLMKLLPSTLSKRRALAKREVIPAAKLLDWMVTG